METTTNPAQPIYSSAGHVWEHPVLVIRDDYDHAKAYRLYWAEAPEENICVQVDGEIDGVLYRTVSAAQFDANRKFPGVPVYRWLWDGSVRTRRPLAYAPKVAANV